MISRQWLLPLGIAAAVGGPMIATSDLLNQPGDSPRPALEDLQSTQPPEMLYYPVANLAEIVRFDVGPAWIAGRWSRVSTAPAADDLVGMRVALVTGPNPWDICGALTYYFDEQKRVQRIQLVGSTGDPNPLIQLLTQQFQFQGHTTQAAGLYTAQRWGKVTGLLRLDHATVLETDNPNQRYSVLLEINQPQSGRSVSQSTLAMATSQPY